MWLCVGPQIGLVKHNQVRGHRTGSSHSGAEEYPREKTQTNQRWNTHKSLLIRCMLPPEPYESEIGSQPTMCQVHTGAYVSLLAPGRTDYTACHPRKTTTYILHVIPITTHTHDRRRSIGKKEQRKKKENIKERKERQGSEKNEKRFVVLARFSVFPPQLASACSHHTEVVVCCCCSHINSHNQVRGHRTGSSHSGAEEYLVAILD